MGAAEGVGCAHRTRGGDENRVVPPGYCRRFGRSTGLLQALLDPLLFDRQGCSSPIAPSPRPCGATCWLGPAARRQHQGRMIVLLARPLHCPPVRATPGQARPTMRRRAPAMLPTTAALRPSHQPGLWALVFLCGGDPAASPTTPAPRSCLPFRLVSDPCRIAHDRLSDARLSERGPDSCALVSLRAPRRAAPPPTHPGVVVAVAVTGVVGLASLDVRLRLTPDGAPASAWRRRRLNIGRSRELPPSSKLHSSPDPSWSLLHAGGAALAGWRKRTVVPLRAGTPRRLHRCASDLL